MTDVASSVVADKVAGWLGTALSAPQTELLNTYAAWLRSEGIASGGIGPGEGQRLWDRHIGDSLAFGYGLHGEGTLIDVGSGVGLPGLPLAIAFPETRVTLLDRSGRRADALRRLCAILGQDATVVHDDVSNHAGRYDRVVSRATFPIAEVVRRLLPLVAESGDIVVGLGSHPTSDQIDRWSDTVVPHGWVSAVIQVPVEILDSAPAMLRIAPT